MQECVFQKCGTTTTLNQTLTYLVCHLGHKELELHLPQSQSIHSLAWHKTQEEVNIASQQNTTVFSSITPFYFSSYLDPFSW